MQDDKICMEMGMEMKMEMERMITRKKVKKGKRYRFAGNDVERMTTWMKV